MDSQGSVEELPRALKRRAQVFLGWFIVLVAALILFRPVLNFLFVPWKVHASWVETLATEDTGLRHYAELRTFGRDYRKSYQDQPGFDLVLKANEQKRQLYSAFIAGTGKRGLFRHSSTVEGRRILHWLLVEDGKVTYVHDHSRDGGAWPWDVSVYHPKKLQLGFLEDGLFVEGEPGITNSPVIVLQADVERHDPARFY